MLRIKIVISCHNVPRKENDKRNCLSIRYNVTIKVPRTNNPLLLVWVDVVLHAVLTVVFESMRSPKSKRCSGDRIALNSVLARRESRPVRNDITMSWQSDPICCNPTMQASGSQPFLDTSPEPSVLNFSARRCPAGGGAVNGRIQERTRPTSDEASVRSSVRQNLGAGNSRANILAWTCICLTSCALSLLFRYVYTLRPSTSSGTSSQSSIRNHFAHRLHQYACPL